MDQFFNYIQIFFLAFFLTLIVGNSIYIRRKKKINPIALKIKLKRLGKLLEILLLLLVNIWAMEVLFYSLNLKSRIFGWPFNQKLFDAFFVKPIGLALIILGFVLLVWAVVNLGTSWRLGISEANPGNLVKSGIFRYCRHPIYVFFNLYFLGTFLIRGNLVFLIFWVAVAAILHYQAISEEKYLTKIYGKSYVDYSKQVGRYITFKIVAIRSNIKGSKQSA